jgi:hypothetical protein
MALHLAFEKSADSMLKKLVKILAGPYVHVEMLVTQTHFHHLDQSPLATLKHSAYSAFMSETFACIDQRDFWYSDDSHDFLSVPVSAEELHRIAGACDACVQSKVPYNTTDMVFSQVPLRNPTERDLYQSKSLFCSQAMVLVLRSCLEPGHKLQGPLALVNSRTITPSHLYEILKPHCSQKTKAQAVDCAYDPRVHV